MSRVTLSFDNGPDPQVTPQVLDVLRRHGVRAQFFVLGQHLVDPARERLVARARDEGHIVGNHSFSHRIPLGIDTRPDAVEQEIAATEVLLSRLWSGPKWFRPFGAGGALGPHLLSARAVDYLVTKNYSCILWNSVPRDWLEPETWIERAMNDCSVREHTLVALHDIPNACLAGLEKFINTVRERGIELVNEVPHDCAPILDGRVMTDLTGLVANSDSCVVGSTP